MPPPGDPAQRLGHALRQLLHLALQSFWRAAREHGLSMSQVFALRYIYHRGTCNISDLAKALGVTPAAASQMLQRLVSQGLVRREENPRDRRNKRLSLTPRGEQTLQALAPSFETLFDRLSPPLSPAELEEIARAVETLTARLSPSPSDSSPSSPSPRGTTS